MEVVDASGIALLTLVGESAVGRFRHLLSVGTVFTLSNAEFKRGFGPLLGTFTVTGSASLRYVHGRLAVGVLLRQLSPLGQPGWLWCPDCFCDLVAVTCIFVLCSVLPSEAIPSYPKPKPLYRKISSVIAGNAGNVCLVAVVTNVSPVQEVSVSGTNTAKRDIVLEDDTDDTITLTLWGADVVTYAALEPGNILDIVDGYSKVYNNVTHLAITFRSVVTVNPTTEAALVLRDLFAAIDE